MSIATELQNYADGLDDSYDAVDDMGGIIPAHKNMNNLDQAIRTIPQGSSYTAGSGIDITGSTISVDNTTVPFFSDLATVATTGDYGDLLNTPTIPTKTSDLQNDGATGNSAYVEATALSDGSVTKVGTSTVGATDRPIYLASGAPTQVNQPTSGAWFQGIPRVTQDGVMEMGKYIDFHNASSDTKDYSVRLYTDNTGSSSVLLPNSNGRLALESQIPTVNDATLTITQNGTSAGTFTANASSNTTIALTDTTYSDFTGATSGTAGAHGLVPAPAAGDQDKYLKGDGTWGTVSGATVFYASDSQLMPSQSTSLNLYHDAALTDAATHTEFADAMLSGNGVSIAFMYSSTAYSSVVSVINTTDNDNDRGNIFGEYIIRDRMFGISWDSFDASATTWPYMTYQKELTAGSNIAIDALTNTISATDTTYSAFTGATSGAAGTSGLVPAPAAGDEGKVLQGDGTWATIASTATISSTDWSALWQ